MVFQPYLSFICLCPAAHPSLITCQMTQLISVLPRTVYLKDTQHRFLGIRISAHRLKHSVQLNRLGTLVNTRIQLSHMNFTERKIILLQWRALNFLFCITLLFWRHFAPLQLTATIPVTDLTFLSLFSLIFKQAGIWKSVAFCAVNVLLQNKKLHGSSPH